MTAGGERWNHNLHYLPLLLDAVPERCERALDIGCGEGTVARRLRAIIPSVSAIDLDERSIQIARGHDSGSEIEYLLGDFLSFPFPSASFDFVVCVAALHHMDARAALQRMAELLRPSGALAVLGLARSSYPADLPREVVAAFVNRAYRVTKPVWESPAPEIWPPSHTYREIRSLAQHSLPHARFRRHLLWRYSITWVKPYPNVQ